MEGNTAVEYRGIPTGRGLTQEYTERSGNSVLKTLSLGFSDLTGVRVLDVGIGRGNAFEEAQHRGLDYYGVDIIPLYDLENLSTNGVRAEHVEFVRENQIRFRQLQEEHPGKLFPADATKQLPFEDESFDVVLSCMSMPGYAHTVQEAVTSVLEMIRVAKTKVVFTGSEANTQQRLGNARGSSQFINMKTLIDTLRSFGAVCEERYIPVNGQKGSESIHIDLSNFDREAFKRKYQDLIQEADMLFETKIDLRR